MRTLAIIFSLILGTQALALTDHGGADWVLTANETVSGTHTNVGSFIIPAGVTAYVAAWNGADGGSLSVFAQHIDIAGLLRADGRGYSGGNGGTGGHGAAGAGGDTPASIAGGTGIGPWGGAGGPSRPGCNYGSADPDYGYHRYWCGQSGYAGTRGGYAASASNGDSTTNELIFCGSGGGGGSGGTGGGGYGNNKNVGGGGGGGGGAGNPGGGAVLLSALRTCRISGSINANGLAAGRGNGTTPAKPTYRYGPGWGGIGGSSSAAGSSAGAGGGWGILADGVTPDPSIVGGAGGSGAAGAGGGILIKGRTVNLSGSSLANLGGGSATVNGGTLKIFYAENYTAGTYASGRVLVQTYESSADIDIGLRLFDGQQNIAIAAEPSGSLTSPLRIAKNGMVYGLPLVETNSASAAPFFIQMPDSIRALKRY